MIVDNINMVLSNHFLKTFIVLITGVFAGYTLQPVPKWLNNLFDTSHLLKYAILTVIGLVTFHPLSQWTLIVSLVAPAALLLLFSSFRILEEKIREEI